MLGTRHRLPLHAVRKNMPPYISPNAAQKHGSPYFLPSDHPMKYFKSGTQDYTSSKRFSIAKLLRAVSTLLKESYNLES